MKKLIALTLAALLGMPLMAAVKMTVSGQKHPEEAVEKDGVYTLAPKGRTRIQIYPKGNYIYVLPDSEIEISAEVSGSGNVYLGSHWYSPKIQWKYSVNGKLFRVDAEESETIKAVTKINKPGIGAVLPWISVTSGKVNVKNLKLRVIGSLSVENVKTAPKLPGWIYSSASKAVKCVENNGAVEIVTARRDIVEMMTDMQVAKDGDKIKFSGSVSGKGRLIVGLHLYDKTNTWQGAIWQQLPITNGKVDKLPEITVKTPAKKKSVVAIRGVVRVTPNCNVKLEKLQISK